MDLTFLTTDVPKVIARKELWQLKADYTTWLEEWKKQYLNQVTCNILFLFAYWQDNKIPQKH